jgi:antitoxin CptB
MDRVRWQCRRGMLEVDLLLNRFLDRGYGQLSDEDRRRFAALLEYPDPILLEWLMGRERPVDPQLAHVVDRVRDAFKP